MDNEKIKEVIENLTQLRKTIFGSIVPENANKHFRSACKEVLLGMIDLLDNCENKKSPKAEAEHQKNHSINITD